MACAVSAPRNSMLFTVRSLLSWVLVLPLLVALITMVSKPPCCTWKFWLNSPPAAVELNTRVLISTPPR
ncbi:hypothetical protein D3C76_794990 [compost metagenome]